MPKTELQKIHEKFGELVCDIEDALKKVEDGEEKDFLCGAYIDALGMWQIMGRQVKA